MEHATVFDLFITEIQAFVLTEFGQTEFVSFIHLMKHRHNEKQINQHGPKQFIHVHVEPSP